MEPILAFVVYGVPAPQGSHEFKGFRNGKPILADQSAALAPWRKAVRSISREAIAAWSRRTGKSWSALDEAVMVSPVVTMPPTQAATKRGDIFATGTPDLDKLERAIGDALSPAPLKPSDGAGLSGPAREQVRTKLMDERRRTAVLHDDSRIAVWDHGQKVYPATTPDSLGYSGVTIRIWRMADLVAVDNAPTVTIDGTQWMTAADMRAWVEPATGETWPETAQRLLSSPHAGSDPTTPVAITNRTVTDAGARRLLDTFLAHGPTARIPVTIS